MYKILIYNDQNNIYTSHFRFEKKGGSRHGGRSGGRLYYNIMRERPLGPHKKLAPNVKLDGRMGAMENYRFEVHWPEVCIAYK